MPSIERGGSSDSATPILDIYIAVGDPLANADVAELEFRILDISTDAKKLSPVQVYPTTAAPSYETLDPLNDSPTGHRLSEVGRYYAPWDVPLDEPMGDHRIEWRFKVTSPDPQQTVTREFYVVAESLPTEEMYCGIADIRAEGFTSDAVSDSRIESLARLATKYIRKMTGRWFHPITFDEDMPMKVDGRGGRDLILHIPIIRIDKLSIENQGLIDGDLTEIPAAQFRVYNRHLTQALEEPDDRERPVLSFIQTRIPQVVSAGLFPEPRIFPKGKQNIWIEGVFGYTEYDGSAFGKTPDMIADVACKLVIRNMILESRTCEALARKNKYRINYDRQRGTEIRLQDLWLRGRFTGDPEIDQILMAFKRPHKMGSA